MNKRRGYAAFAAMAAIILFTTIKLSACGGAAESAPAPVDGLLAVAGDGLNIVVWNVSKNAATYNLYWDTEAGVTPAKQNMRAGTKVESLKSTAYFHTNLTNGLTYYYTVTAVSEGGKESAAAASEVSAMPKSTVNCPATQLLCQDKCVNVQTDRNNCGACKNVCATTDNCVAGVCQSGA